MSAVKSLSRAPSKRKSVQRASSQGLGQWRLISYPLSLLGGLSVFLWLWAYGSPLGSEAFQIIERVTAGMGLTLDDVVVEGRKHTDKNQILTLLQLKRGIPLISLDLREAREKLKTLPWIKSTRIERKFPSTLMIRLSEKDPIALWRDKGATYLIDRDGDRIETKESHKYKTLPLITGHNAPTYMGEFFFVLEKFPTLKARVTGATHLRSSRWNIRLDNRIEVKLPEKGLENALAYLCEFEHNQLRKQKIMSIDMRLPGQLTLRLEPEILQKQKKTGRDA